MPIEMFSIYFRRENTGCFLYCIGGEIYVRALLHVNALFFFLLTIKKCFKSPLCKYSITIQLAAESEQATKIMTTGK